MKKLNIIYIDNHIIVVHKPAGLLIQGDKTGDDTLFEQVKRYIKDRFNKPGNVYLGLVHRLDRPTSGVVVFARTSKAAARLSEQFKHKTVKKIYWALVEGNVPSSGKLIHYISREGVNSIICPKEKGKKAELSFIRKGVKDNVSFVEVLLDTGRHHQIRVQFHQEGHTVLGDFRYGSKRRFDKRSIALHAYSIEIEHPTKKERMVFSTLPDRSWNAYI